MSNPFRKPIAEQMRNDGPIDPFETLIRMLGVEERRVQTLQSSIEMLEPTCAISIASIQYMRDELTKCLEARKNLRIELYDALTRTKKHAGIEI